MTAFDFEGLLALRNAPRPYFFGLAIIFVESMSYISSTLILTAYLSAELGFSDKQAGWIYTVFGMACSLVSILGGFVIDKFGVRATLLTGSIALAISRFAMALTGNGSVFVFFLISCLPIGSTLCYVTMLTGIKRWTSLETRAFGFSMFYIAMNFGALLGGLFTDAMRHSVGYDHCALPSATTHAPHKLWLASPMSDSPFAFTPIPSATTPHVWSDTALSHDISSAFGSTVVSGLLGASASMSYYDSNHTMEAWMINHAVQFPLSPLQTHSLKFASSPALFTKTSHSKLPNMLFRNGATGVDLSKAQAAKPKKTFLGVPLSDAYRLVFLFGALSTLFIFPIVYFFIPEITGMCHSRFFALTK
jgi:MFS family permease